MRDRGARSWGKTRASSARHRAAALAAAGLVATALTLTAASCNMLNPYGTGPFDVDAGVGSGQCEGATDCPGLFTDCRAPTCENTNCGTHNEIVGAPCDDDGGQICDGLGSCVECVEPSHCEADEICQSNLCVPASCGDGTQNSGETDVDCGGPCAPCSNGQACSEAADCVSGYCASDTCAPCTITDDCADTHWCDAGVCVPKKQSGDSCSDPVQCASGFCPAQDGVCCNQECLGLCMACIPGQTGVQLGQCGPVLAGDDFVGECLDQGATSCGSTGEGCDGTGACILYPSGTVCVPASCAAGERQRPDTCDGAGLCEDNGIEPCSPYECSGTDCRTSCSDDGHCLSGSYCDGTNHCVSAGGQGDPCGGNNECNSGYCVDGRCCESACTGTCMACSNVKTGFANGLCRSIPTTPIPNDPDDECAQGACYRVDNTTGECRYNQGHTCSSTAQCLQSPCVDGYCCENDCTGLCRSCDGSQTVGSNGYCRTITASSDPDGECPDDGATSCGSNGDGCDGAGACILYPSGTVCQSGSCSAAVWTLPDLCNGAGTCINSGVQDCSPYQCDGAICRTSCQLQSHCLGTYYCDPSHQCVSQHAVGDPCGSDLECLYGYCVDGYCCDSACTGVCMACRGDWTGGSNGECSAIPLGQDPDSECSTYCDGGGACWI